MPFEYKYCPAPDGCEDVEKYELGGYHPVRLYDDLLNGRYIIVHN